MARLPVPTPCKICGKVRPSAKAAQTHCYAPRYHRAVPVGASDHPGRGGRPMACRVCGVVLSTVKAAKAHCPKPGRMARVKEAPAVKASGAKEYVPEHGPKHVPRWFVLA